MTQTEVLVNLAFAIFLCGLVATHLKICGFDKPVRDDGVTPEWVWRSGGPTVRRRGCTPWPCGS